MNVTHLKLLQLEKDDDGLLQYCFLVRAKKGILSSSHYMCFLTTPKRITESTIRALLETISVDVVEKKLQEAQNFMGGNLYFGCVSISTPVGDINFQPFTNERFRLYGLASTWERFPFRDKT